VASSIPHTTADRARYPHNPCLDISKGDVWARSVGFADPPDVTDQGDFLGSNPTARSKTRTTGEQERGANVICIRISTMHQSAAYLARGESPGPPTNPSRRQGRIGRCLPDLRKGRLSCTERYGRQSTQERLRQVTYNAIKAFEHGEDILYPQPAHFCPLKTFCAASASSCSR
jgi:hypothetical protein